ncbi:MAG: Uma2 family endonuclease [Acidobacteriota bacterium]|nr:Uma2 family endonuclease [Acidobacteriota bacterium]
MTTSLRWTSADLEALPDNGKRYEIIDGELYMSKQPHWHHQRVSFQIAAQIEAWNSRTGAGQVNLAPGVIFADDEDVAPDVVWISSDRLATALQPDGKLHAAPELVIEVLLPGSINERRDREAKLKLYSRRGVYEYWIIDWRARKIEVYRREGLVLQLTGTLYQLDTLESPLLPSFTCSVATIFENIV